MSAGVKPGAVSSPAIVRRPAVAMRSGSAGPRTSGPLPAAPVEVGGDQPEAPRSPEGFDRGCETARRTGREQSLRRDPALPAQRRADVLVVDEPVDQGDPAAEPCGQRARLQVLVQPLQQFGRAADA
jgi:hypothetical protein